MKKLKRKDLFNPNTVTLVTREVDAGIYGHGLVCDIYTNNQFSIKSPEGGFIESKTTITAGFVAADYACIIFKALSVIDPHVADNIYRIIMIIDSDVKSIAAEQDFDYELQRLVKTGIERRYYNKITGLNQLNKERICTKIYISEDDFLAGVDKKVKKADLKNGQIYFNNVKIKNKTYLLLTKMIESIRSKSKSINN